MKLRTIVIVAALALAGVLAWRLLRAPPGDDAARIRARFEEAATAAGERRAGDVVALLSEGFRGTGLGGPYRGEGLGRDEVRRILAFELLRGQWTSVAIGGVEVAVAGDRARANVDAVLVRGGDGKKLSDLVAGQAAAHRFACRLARVDGEWIVVEAAWQPIGLEDALAGPPPADAPDR